MRIFSCLHLIAFSVCLTGPSMATAQVLDKQKQLDDQKFWDNRDWDWYSEQIPFFECPDAEITTTYYYRWELLTKHLTYGSPNSGYSFTEFIDRPFWSGAYGAISCPAGHQLYEARWLRNPEIARDYARYWFQTPGAQPRNYSTWLADAIWAVGEVHPDDEFVNASTRKQHPYSEPDVVAHDPAVPDSLLSNLVKNYEGWEQRHFVPEVGLFWQTGHDDGMEFNINSRQTQDLLRGAPSYRPSFNAYMWADAVAIAKIARRAGNDEVAWQFEKKAESLKSTMLRLLWDDKRQFFFPAFKNDEERDGHKIKALSKTYESGQFAGDAHGRELIGYVPWQFNMIDPKKGYEVAWKKLMDREAFYADFGPTTVERNDPMFLLQKSCCWWSGQSWPYATTQTLKAMANLLQGSDQSVVSSADYVKLLQIFARSHRKEGRPYLAEALHPDTGSFEGHDGYNHSEHYFHSGYCDLVITGLVGLKPTNDASFQVHPLAPFTWDWFALDDVAYRGRSISVVWDRLGTRYNLGRGFFVLADGKTVASAERLEPLTVSLPPLSKLTPLPRDATTVNFVVNNDGTYYPRLTASYSAPTTSISKLNDGNFWYVPHPPNRWTCEGSPNERDWVIVDFGTKRPIHTIKLYPLDDDGENNSTVNLPKTIDLEIWIDGAWQPIKGNAGHVDSPLGHRANVVRFEPIETTKLRVTLHHSGNGKSGLSEIEAWGDAKLPLAPADPPVGNLAYNPGLKNNGGVFPKATASHTSRFDRVEWANDGIVSFLPTPANRWTSYESKSPTDWLEIEFARPTEFRRIELAIYDDRGGVQAPSSYAVETWNGNEWRRVTGDVRTPEQPIGGQWNEIRFDPVTSSKVRIVFTHRGGARSGVSEVLIWND